MFFCSPNLIKTTADFEVGVQLSSTLTQNMLVKGKSQIFESCQKSHQIWVEEKQKFKSLFLPFTTNFIILWFYFDYLTVFEGINIISNFVRLKLLKRCNFVMISMVK